MGSNNDKRFCSNTVAFSVNCGNRPDAIFSDYAIDYQKILIRMEVHLAINWREGARICAHVVESHGRCNSTMTMEMVIRGGEVVTSGHPSLLAG